jgi:hypothetical protein
MSFKTNPPLRSFFLFQIKRKEKKEEIYFFIFFILIFRRLSLKENRDESINRFAGPLSSSGWKRRRSSDGTIRNQVKE